MGNSPGLSKRITIHHELEELQLIRAALRFAQASKERPLTFDQDCEATVLITRISLYLLSA